MALIRWEPAPFSTDFSRLFNSFFDTPTTAASSAARRWIPAVDLTETEGEYVLKADLPGLTDKDVHIEVENNVLTVSGERKSEHEEKGNGFHRVERTYGAFSRRLALPEGVDPEAVKASFENGALEVHVPKPEARRPHKVAITAGEGIGTIDAGETTGDESAS
jgi:HSP20 family protein